MKKSTLLILAVIGLVIVTGIGLSLKYRTNYQTTALTRGEVVESIYGIATVVPRQQFHFKVGLAKTLTKALVREGDLVTRGQKLLELSDGIAVRAPFDGVVTEFPYSVGENVFPELNVVSVEDLKNPFVEASLDQQGALRVRKGLPVKLVFETIQGQTFLGVVDSIYPQKGQFIVRIEVKELPPQVLPGMTADAAIEVDRKPDVLLIPVNAVNQGRVILLKNGRKTKLDLKIGLMDHEKAEVLSGDLQAGDEVILNR